MIGAMTTPKRGALTDASSRVNSQRTSSFTDKPQYQYLSSDSFTTPDCKQFNLDYYFSKGPSSQSPHRRLRRDTSTRALRSLARYHQTRPNRSPYDTSPHTPSKLSKVMIAEYELSITDIDTPPLTMPTRLSLNKKLPPMPIFRLGNSPERRGLLDATDLNSSSLQFPILQPESATKENGVVEISSSEPTAQDLSFVTTQSISQKSEADSDFEVGIAQVGTVYGASTTLKVSTPQTVENMVSPPVRQNKSSVGRKQFNEAKIASAPKSTKPKHFGLSVPEGGDRRNSSSGFVMSRKNNGSPLPKKDRRGRSSLGNGERDSPVLIENVDSGLSAMQTNLPSIETDNSNENSEEPLVQVSSSNNNNDVVTDTSIQDAVIAAELATDQEDITQSAQDVVGGVLQASDQEDTTQGAAETIVPDQLQGPVNHTVQAIAESGPMGRSESQTTIGRQKKMVPPPSKRFARDADRTIMGRSPPYSKVTSRVYMKDTIEKNKQQHIGLHMARKAPTIKPKALKRVLATRPDTSNVTEAALTVEETNVVATPDSSRRISSLPDSPENQTLKPPVLTMEKNSAEKRESATDRLTKPTASSAARAKSRKSTVVEKSGTMASMKNAGKGLKSRLSGMIRSRRASGVVGITEPAARSSENAAEETLAQSNITSAILEKAPEIAPLVEEGDVGEEFASFYSQITYPAEYTVAALQITAAVEPIASDPNGGSELVNTPVTAEFSSMSEPPARPPPAVPQETDQAQSEDFTSADVLVAAGNGASDPPPNESGNSGHGDAQVQTTDVEDDMVNEIRTTLDSIRDALATETDAFEQARLTGWLELLTFRLHNINNSRVVIMKLKAVQDKMLIASSTEAYNVRTILSDLSRRARANI